MQGDRTAEAVRITMRHMHKLVMRRIAAVDKMVHFSLGMQHLRKPWGVHHKIPQKQGCTGRRADLRVINAGR